MLKPLTPARRSLMEGMLIGCLFANARMFGAEIAWKDQPGLSAKPVRSGGSGRPGFTQMPMASTGIQFTNALPWSRHSTNQILLNGSGVAAGDLDGDGWCDLVFCGLGGGSVVFRNLGGWKFENVTARNGLDLSKPDATGAVCADVDGDGNWNLFIGGRSVPGLWPEPASSVIFLREQGGWIRDAASSNLLGAIGLVSRSLFSDLNGDGAPDLVLACEWGPLRLFRNTAGKLSTWDPPVKCAGLQLHSLSTLSQFTGWWNGVNAGDFDGDGRMDLIAANWGRNSKYERFRTKPLRVYFGDFNGDERVGILENWFDPALGSYTPIHDVWTLSRSMPWLLARFNNYDSFARASIEQVLGDKLGNTRHWEPAWLDTTVFLNRGDHFEAQSLPEVAQHTPAFAPCVADFDGDGHEDVFLSQNFFGVRAGGSRHDAGRGLLLRGDGRGGFTPVNGQESGLLIYGEQRGAAVGDFDNDGRADLIATQFNEQTKVYRNETARPGLRVRLKGSPGNPQAVGAQLRLGFAPRFGAVA